MRVETRPIGGKGQARARLVAFHVLGDAPDGIAAFAVALAHRNPELRSDVAQSAPAQAMFHAIVCLRSAASGLRDAAGAEPLYHSAARAQFAHVGVRGALRSRPELSEQAFFRKRARADFC